MPNECFYNARAAKEVLRFGVEAFHLLLVYRKELPRVLLREYDECMKSQIVRIVTGLVIVAVGVGFLLDSANVIEFGEFAATWWPLFVILAGLVMFINDTRSYLWAIVVTGVGVLFQLRELDVVDVDPWQLFWPAVVIVVGLSIVFSRSPGHKVSKAERDDMTAILGGSEQMNTSTDFKGSKLTAVMGGTKLDLRKAKIKKEATVELFTFWGGIELIVPRNVIVRNQTSAILGGVEDKTDQDAAKDAPVLYVIGDVIMAGVEIKN